MGAHVRRSPTIPRQKFDFVNPKSTPEPSLKPNTLKTCMYRPAQSGAIRFHALLRWLADFKDFASRHPPIPLQGDQDANSRSAAA
jgi:hypothetical protein